MNWNDDGREMKKLKGYRSGCERYYFQEGITWGSISSSTISVRFSPVGFMPNRKGAMAYSGSQSQLKYVLGLLNSTVASAFLSFLAPTLDFSEGPVGSVPLLSKEEPDLKRIVELSIDNSKTDWDSFETSWDFKRSPLI